MNELITCKRCGKYFPPYDLEEDYDFGWICHECIKELEGRRNDNHVE